MTDRLEFKAALTVSDAGEIEGIAWPFGSADRVGDVIEKGAFNQPARLPMLFAHDQGQAIGIWDSIAETAEGLQVKGRLLIEEVARAREVRALVRERAVAGLSIGFVTRKAAPRRGGGRTITALDLHEISIVAVPSHPGATITSMKAATDDPATKGNIMENELPATAPEIAEIEQKAANAADAVTKLTQRFDKLEAKLNRPSAANNNHPDADNDNGVEQKAFYDYLRTGRVEEKALAYAPPSTGGVLAPKEVSASIIERVTEFSPVRAVASTIRMSGPLLQLPRLVDDVVVGEVTETATRPEDEPSFELIDVKPFEMSVIVPVTRIMLEDAQISLEGYLRNYLGKRYGEKESGWFINGNGTTQAEGVLTSAEVGEFEASTTAIKADDLIDTFYSIKTAYSASGVWLMNRFSMAVVRKLKDTDGSYLWQPSIAAGTPPTLLGRPVYEAPHMPNPAAGATPIVFGDFGSGYMIADRVDFEFDTDPKSAWSTGIVKMLTRRRVGGRVVLGEALTKLTLAAA
jgi:HK97 family phage major capsid protein/HK97 family phage prohead protease